MQEAESSMNRLIELVEGLVASNSDPRLRIDVLGMDYAAGQTITYPPARPSRDGTPEIIGLRDPSPIV
jgi:hypothetical protein